MNLRVVIAVVIGLLVIWSVIATTLWALDGEGPTRVQTVTVETP